MLDGVDSGNIVYANIAISNSGNCAIRNGTLRPHSHEAILLTDSNGTNITNMRMLCNGGATSGVTANSSSGTVIRGCEIKNGGYDGVTLSGSANCTVEQTLICSSRRGVLISNGSDAALVKNTTIMDNRDSGIVLSSISGANIRNNIVVNNGKINWKWGIQAESGTVQNLSLTYNDVWDNRENYGNCAPGAGSLMVDPLLAGGCSDAHLQSGSPCIDAGDPGDSAGNEPAPNGGRINLGSYGGTSDGTTTSPVEITVAEAAANGWLNLYCYPWQDVQYDQISGFPTATNTIIPPWCGFWVIVNQDVDIVFPHNPDAQIPAAGSVMSKELQNSWYYLSTVPLTPSNGDVNAVFGDDLGSGLHDGSAGQKWRVSKWDVTTGRNARYTGPGSMPELIPGRGFWIRHVYGGPRTVTVTGSPVDNTKDYSLKLKCTGGETYHMVGNPFPYSIDWRAVKVRAPMTDALQAGKVASGFKDIRTWEMNLKLSTADGVCIDANNKAGIILSGADYSYMLNAVDMDPFAEDYVRMYLLDPNDPDKKMYAFDYRGPDKNVYAWDIVLSTSRDEARATLDLGNSLSIPDQYTASLTAPDGTKTDIAGDAHIPVTLSRNADTVYRLTLTRTVPVSVADESVPRPFGITGVSPNPFNPSTTIEYLTERSERIALSVYNITGQRVAVLTDGIVNAGSHAVTWNAAGQASGVYFAVLEAGGKRDVRKMLLMR